MNEHVLLWKAIHDLEIDTPVLSYELLGPHSIRLYLYGGKVTEYTLPPPVEQAKQRPPAAKGRRAP